MLVTHVHDVHIYIIPAFQFSQQLDNEGEGSILILIVCMGAGGHKGQLQVYSYCLILTHFDRADLAV